MGETSAETHSTFARLTYFHYFQFIADEKVTVSLPDFDLSSAFVIRRVIVTVLHHEQTLR